MDNKSLKIAGACALLILIFPPIGIIVTVILLLKLIADNVWDDDDYDY